MESLDLETLFGGIYKNKTVFITGHTGFKGSWLAAIFHKLKVQVTGEALAPETNPNHFNLLNIDYKTTIGNITSRYFPLT